MPQAVAGAALAHAEFPHGPGPCDCALNGSGVEMLSAGELRSGRTSAGTTTEDLPPIDGELRKRCLSVGEDDITVDVEDAGQCPGVERAYHALPEIESERAELAKTDIGRRPDLDERLVRRKRK